MENNIKTKIIETRDFLAKPSAWVKGYTFATRKVQCHKSSFTESDILNCNCACLIGAIRVSTRRAQNDYQDPITNTIIYKIYNLLPNERRTGRLTSIRDMEAIIQLWNDSPKTRHQDILNILDLAVAKEK